MLRSIATKVIRTRVQSAVRLQSTATSIGELQLFNPTEEHASLRTMLRDFVEKEVDPQALKHNREEKFNVDLFRKLGDLGLLGITVDPEFGGSGMDAVAAVIAHGMGYILPILYKTYILSYTNLYLPIIYRGAGCFGPCVLPLLPSSLHAFREQPCPQRYH